MLHRHLSLRLTYLTCFSTDKQIEGNGKPPSITPCQETASAAPTLCNRVWYNRTIWITTCTSWSPPQWLCVSTFALWLTFADDKESAEEAEKWLKWQPENLYLTGIDSLKDGKLALNSSNTIWENSFKVWPLGHFQVPRSANFLNVPRTSCFVSGGLFLNYLKD